MKNGRKNKKIPPTSRLLEVCDLLNREGASYLIVGGQALNLHGVIRATQDVDVLIPKDRANVEKVLTALGQMGFGIAKELDADEVLSKPWTIIGDTPRVDLMTVANKVKYEEAIKSSLKRTIEGVGVPFVDVKTLIKTKETDRLQDLADIERLKAFIPKS